ncbi:hypothetical protein KBX37_20780 [Micromonospora sp. U56]|uniref:hypothetical protein n=1 Tax=Micromonospora sp. U56 TaxID=2824900 RepID=UPI001B3643BF|nr:hypothetical protein [Micromonospora sp. U56]MBQ0895505.1 hypothetical protein [Micromonospora sp. U56]
MSLPGLGWGCRQRGSANGRSVSASKLGMDQLPWEDSPGVREEGSVGFDFGRLSTGNAINKITDPAALFDALPNKAGGYVYLRAVQKTVLDAWSAVRDRRDVVIKTNTGGGKTVLILQCCLHEKKGPALFWPRTRTWRRGCVRKRSDWAWPWSMIRRR